MVDKNKMRILLNEKKFNEILSSFYDEYKILIKNFLTRNGLVVPDDTSLELMLFTVKANYPEQKIVADEISFLINCEDDSMQRLDYTLDRYKYIKEKLT